MLTLKLAIAKLLLAFLPFAQFVPTVPATAASGGTNPAFVQATSCQATSAASCTMTVTAIGASHGLYVVCITAANCSTPTATGETFTTFTGTSGCQDFTGDYMQCYIVSSTVGGETSVVCNTSASNSLMCAVIEFTRPQGLATPKDAGGHGQNAGATSFTVSTSAATTVSNDFDIATFGSLGATFTNAFTVSSGYTQATNSNFGSGTGQLLTEYKIASGTGTQSATSTLGTSARATYAILSVKP